MIQLTDVRIITLCYFRFLRYSIIHENQTYQNRPSMFTELYHRNTVSFVRLFLPKYRSRSLKIYHGFGAVA